MLGKSRPAVLLIATGFLGFAFPSSAQVPATKAGCAPHDPFTATVSAVRDGRTLELVGGRAALLGTIEAPGTRARDALAADVVGKELTFSLLSPQPDRYGRTVVQAFVGGNGPARTLDAELMAKGFAFFRPAGVAWLDPGCRALLLAAENTARQGKLGLWGDPDYDTKASDNTAAILAARGRFAIIEGKVLSVRDSGGTVYINFGRRWSEDFTVTILKRIAAKFVTAGIDPKRLEGRRIRVRGFVEERGGPWIEATIPEQIEIADGR